MGEISLRVFSFLVLLQFSLSNTLLLDLRLYGRPTGSAGRRALLEFATE